MTLSVSSKAAVQVSISTLQRELLLFPKIMRGRVNVELIGARRSSFDREAEITHAMLARLSIVTDISEI